MSKEIAIDLGSNRSVPSIWQSQYERYDSVRDWCVKEDNGVLLRTETVPYPGFSHPFTRIEIWEIDCQVARGLRIETRIAVGEKLAPSERVILV